MSGDWGLGTSHSVSHSVSVSFTNLKNVSKLKENEEWRMENGECWALF